MWQLKPAQTIALSFLLVILVGAILLSLPIAAADGQGLNFIDALFMSTSATCVTGLVVVDTGSYFTMFGQLVIMILIQLGGLGIMTFSTFFILLLGKKMSLRGNVVLRDVLNQQGVAGLGGLIKYILLFTFTIEGLGGLLLFIRFFFFKGSGFYHSLYSALFHAISAFCNAGFSLYKTSLVNFSGDYFINLVMALLIICGGLGFTVFLDLGKLKIWSSERKKSWRGLTLQTRTVIYTTCGLIILGTLLFFLFEYNNTLAGRSFGEKILAAFFQSVTARTAGFNTVAINKMASESLFLMIILMFIGASPGSTGGGIKTCTLIVIFAAVIAMVKNSDDVELLKRRLPRSVVYKAFSIAVISAVVLSVFIMILLVTEDFSHTSESFLQIVFEMVSAMGTVGLSTGITSSLSYIGRLVIVMAMFIGRIGPLTLALAIGQRENKGIYHYVEEHIMVG